MNKEVCLTSQKGSFSIILRIFQSKGNFSCVSLKKVIIFIDHGPKKNRIIYVSKIKIQEIFKKILTKFS